jgi:protein-disulfide isomerase
MVKPSIRAVLVSLMAVLCLLATGRPSQADIEWTEKKQFKLDVSPIDMATSPDGKWVIFLSRGEVLVYSVPDDRIAGRTPVDKTFDKLTYSAADDTVILSSSTAKTLKFIQMDVVQKFSLAGLPFKGPENAPVTIVVFSDYQ